MNYIQYQDIRQFAKTFGLAGELQNTTFLITGATGLIGSNLIFCLLSINRGIRIIAPVRNVQKAEHIFGDSVKNLELIECDILHFNYDSIKNVDYIVHCAAPTSSKFFVEKPLETFCFILDSTEILLNYAYNKKIKGFVFLSSLEVYGECQDGNKIIDEGFQGYIDPLSVRSSYPMAKRAAEHLCALYAKVFGVPVKIARLTQTTGAGIAEDDNRVIAQFARLTALGKDIVLRTTGEAARPYCYTTDCVSAILFILLKGKDGEAYNVANEDTYISVKEMAEYLQKNFNPKLNIVVETNQEICYAPVTKLHLSAAKLMGLGWKPEYGLNELFRNLIKYLNAQK